MVVRSPILVVIWKILVGIRLSLSSNYSFVYAIHSSPHLYIALIISKIRNIPFFFSHIASDYEWKAYNLIINCLISKLITKPSLHLVPNEHAIAWLLELGIPEKKIIKYPNLDLVNLEGFHDLKIRNEVDLIVVSRLVRDKHIDSFISIVERLAKICWNTNALIVGPANQFEYLQNLTKAKGLERMKFTGFVSSSRALNILLNKSKIFIFTSSH